MRINPVLKSERTMVYVDTTNVFSIPLVVLIHSRYSLPLWLHASRNCCHKQGVVCSETAMLRGSPNLVYYDYSRLTGNSVIPKLTDLVLC